MQWIHVHKWIHVHMFMNYWDWKWKWKLRDSFTLLHFSSCSINSGKQRSLQKVPQQKGLREGCESATGDRGVGRDRHRNRTTPHFWPYPSPGLYVWESQALQSFPSLSQAQPELRRPIYLCWPSASSRTGQTPPQRGSPLPKWNVSGILQLFLGICGLSTAWKLA